MFYLDVYSVLSKLSEYRYFYIRKDITSLFCLSKAFCVSLMGISPTNRTLKCHRQFCDWVSGKYKQKKILCVPMLDYSQAFLWLMHLSASTIYMCCYRDFLYRKKICSNPFSLHDFTKTGKLELCFRQKTLLHKSDFFLKN